MVVLPVPMAPSTRVTLLRGMPPSRIESRPLIPVRAKFSGVGMRFTALVSFAIGTFAMLLGEAGPRCGIWLLHPSAFERSNDREPSGSARCSPEQWCEGIVVVIEHLKGIHPSPSGLVLCSRDHFRRDEGFQRRRDLLEVVPHESDQAFAGQQQDRKSTRLNSSHVAISYAVFR